MIYVYLDTKLWSYVIYYICKDFHTTKNNISVIESVLLCLS